MKAIFFFSKAVILTGIHFKSEELLCFTNTLSGFEQYCALQVSQHGYKQGEYRSEEQVILLKIVASVGIVETQLHAERRTTITVLSAAASTELRISSNVDGFDPLLRNYCCKVCGKWNKRLHKCHHIPCYCNFW